MTNIFQHLPAMLINRMKAEIELLNKTKVFIKDKGMSEVELLETRLAPDMFPFKKQIQILSDNAKGAIARLNGIENPAYPDTENTIDELIQRLEKTIKFVEANPITNDEKALETKVSFPWVPGMELRAMDYVIEYLIPNFHFHATVAYAILRGLGMEIGKADYLSKLSYQPASS